MKWSAGVHVRSWNWLHTAEIYRAANGTFQAWSHGLELFCTDHRQAQIWCSSRFARLLCSALPTAKPWFRGVRWRLHRFVFEHIIAFRINSASFFLISRRERDGSWGILLVRRRVGMVCCFRLSLSLLFLRAVSFSHVYPDPSKWVSWNLTNRSPRSATARTFLWQIQFCVRPQKGLIVLCWRTVS